MKNDMFLVQVQAVIEIENEDSAKALEKAIREKYENVVMGPYGLKVSINRNIFILNEVFITFDYKIKRLDSTPFKDPDYAILEYWNFNSF